MIRPNIRPFGGDSTGTASALTRYFTPRPVSLSVRCYWTTAMQPLLLSLATLLPSHGTVDEGMAAHDAGIDAVEHRRFKDAADRGSPAGKHLLASSNDQDYGVL